MFFFRKLSICVFLCLVLLSRNSFAEQSDYSFKIIGVNVSEGLSKADAYKKAESMIPGLRRCYLSAKLSNHSSLNYILTLSRDGKVMRAEVLGTFPDETRHCFKAEALKVRFGKIKTNPHISNSQKVGFSGLSPVVALDFGIPGPRLRVTSCSSAGTLSDEASRKGIQAKLPILQQCLDRTFQIVRNEMSLILKVTRNGKVSHVKSLGIPAEKGTLPCVEQQAATIRFEQTKGTSLINVKLKQDHRKIRGVLTALMDNQLDNNFEHGSALKILLKNSPSKYQGYNRVPVLKLGHPIVKGPLSPENSRSVLRRKLTSFRNCFGPSDENKNKIVIRAVINPSGAVIYASIQNSIQKNKNIENCLLKHFRKLSFPQNQDGKVSIVTFPFILDI